MAAGRFYRPILHESKTFEMKQKTMKFEIPGLIRVGSAHRLFSGTVLDLTSQYTGYEGGAVSISTVEESYEGTRDNCLGRASTDLKLQEKFRQKMHDSCKIGR